MSYLYLFFFFKQKTAYEMRISDWSSDVCSSDLGIHRQCERQHRPDQAGCLEAIRAAAGNALAGARDRTAAGPIECVTHACRAVGDEVVVAIFGVLGPSIPFEISDQFTALRGVEIKLLQINTATTGGVGVQRADARLHVGERQRGGEGKSGYRE